MGKYIITHACGHTEEIQLFGPIEGRMRKIKWLEGLDCDECQAQTIDLEGTARQKLWANKIKGNCLYSVNQWITPRLPLITDADKYKNDVRYEKALRNLNMMIDLRDNTIPKIKLAKWWIDHRYEVEYTHFISQKDLDEFITMFSL